MDINWDVIDGSTPQTNGGTIAEFHLEAVQNKALSDEQGTPVFENVEFVTLRNIGSRDTVVKKVDAKIKQRFPMQYARFKAGQEQVPDGIPLKEWPAIDKAQVMTAQQLGIFTVEQFAASTDNVIQKFGMGGLALREKAKAYLAVDKDKAAAMKFASENANLKQEVEMLKKQVEELAKLADKRRSKSSDADS